MINSEQINELISNISMDCNDLDDELYITDNGITRICDQYAIMRKWEEPLMKRYAEIVCQRGGDILEIGFGMGLSASEIQKQPNIKSHTIVEVHPQILVEAHKFQQEHDNVEIIPIDWFRAFKRGLLLNKKYDGIFYDAEFDDDAFMFHRIVSKYLIKDNGIFTWFNKINGKANEWAIDCEYEKFEFKDFPELDPSSGYTKNPYMISNVNHMPFINFKEIK